MTHFVKCRLEFVVALEDAQCSPSGLARAILGLIPKPERIGAIDMYTLGTFVSRVAGQTIVTEGDKKPRATVTFLEEAE